MMDLFDRIVTIVVGLLALAVALLGLGIAIGMVDSPDFAAISDSMDATIDGVSWLWWLAAVIAGGLLLPLGIRLALAQLRPGVSRGANSIPVSSTDRGSTSAGAVAVERAVESDLEHDLAIRAAKVLVTSVQPRPVFRMQLDIGHDVTMSQVGSAVERVAEHVSALLNVEIVEVDVLVRPVDSDQDVQRTQPRVH